jgi:hypothetical protein
LCNSEKDAEDKRDEEKISISEKSGERRQTPKWRGGHNNKFILDFQFDGIERLIVANNNAMSEQRIAKAFFSIASSSRGSIRLFDVR